MLFGSPLGAYLEDLDLAFVLDVNSGYGPWLVEADRLFKAMNTADFRTWPRSRALRTSADARRRVGFAV